MLASTREKRANAGNKMGKMLDEEDEEQDDFYKNTYGGFEEEQEDDDYKANSDLDIDIVDSDFSDDEDEYDEGKSDADDDGDRRRRRKPITTKSYKEPVQFDKMKTKEEKEAESKKRQERKDEIKTQHRHRSTISKERRSMRETTIVKTQDYQKKLKHHLDQPLRKRKEKTVLTHGKTLKELQEFTQAQLLLEAEDTERDNLRSLELYRKMELEKKRSKVIRQLKQVAYIRTHSTRMPVLYSGVGEIDVDANCPMEGPLSHIHKPIEYCERTFVTYTNERNFNYLFPKRKFQPPRQPLLCGVTRKPAKYFDPVTKTPYSSRGAFKILRMIHSKCVKRKLSKHQPLDQSPIVLT